MSAPSLKWYDSSDVLISASQDLTPTPATPAVASTPVEFRLYNNKGGTGADTAYDRYLSIKVRTPGETAYVSSGKEPVDEYWFEARLVAGLGGLTISASSWTPLGAGRFLKLPALANVQGVKLELRLNSTAGPQTTDIEWTLSVERRTSSPLPVGITEAVGQGIALGIGDTTATWLLAVAGNVVENPGGVDQQVRVDDVTWVAAGIPYRVVRHLLTVNNTDGDSATLSAGEKYKALVYAKGDGTIALAKGSKSSGTPTDPATPAGGLAIAMVLREFDALINNADITNTYQVGAAGFTSSGLTATLGPWRAIADNRLLEVETAYTVALTASQTNRVWLLPDGSLSSTITATPPETRALLLWEAVTDATTVTSSTDRRLFYSWGYRLQRLDFLFDATLAVGQKQRRAYLGERTGYILPLGGIEEHLIDNGDTSGATTVDINLRAPGGAFATLFTSQGTEDRRPSIANNSTLLYDSDAAPEVLAVPAHSLLEVEVDAIPGGSIPAWMNVVVLIAVP